MARVPLTSLYMLQKCAVDIFVACNLDDLRSGNDDMRMVEKFCQTKQEIFLSQSGREVEFKSETNLPRNQSKHRVVFL